MTVQEVKEMDIVDYLSGIGYIPVKVSGRNFWYISPLRSEKTASFKVNQALNRWYDFAEGKGGNLVDFGILYHKCSVAELLQKFKSEPDPIRSFPCEKKNIPYAENSPTNVLEIISVKEIVSPALLSYLYSRKIPLSLGSKYLKEIRYKIGDKMYYSLGFKNVAGGYELRSRYFKGSSSPKEVTFIENGCNNLNVFEGFFNFLSYLTLIGKNKLPGTNFLILNSASFFEKSIPKMLMHDSVDLYLDNDKTGRRLTQNALDIDSRKFFDKRSLYHGYNDLNEMLIKQDGWAKYRPGPG